VATETNFKRLKQIHKQCYARQLLRDHEGYSAMRRHRH